MRRLQIWGLVGLMLVAGGVSARGQATQPACSMCAEWNKPQTPFRIYGNTYYVGPHGLASILIASDHGLVLIDGAIAESVPQIVANIKTLGFRIEDVKLIVNSHAHHDHAGGIAELQRLSGAKVMASEWSAGVFKAGGVGKGDPQLGDIRGIAPIADVSVLHDGETLKVGNLALTAHLTPGHTPGGTSWTWQSCEADKCLNMVYFDSISAVAAPGFKFTEHRGALADFEKSFRFLETVPCDVLLTPHSEASSFWERIAARDAGKADALVDKDACRKLAERGREQLKARVKSETGQ